MPGIRTQSSFAFIHFILLVQPAAQNMAETWMIMQCLGILTLTRSLACVGGPDCTEQATRHFFIDAKIGYICKSKDSLSNTEIHSDMRTFSGEPTQ